MTDPKLLCRAHLLGEHRYLHALAVRGKSVSLRHSLLVAEMRRRGYVHKSPVVSDGYENFEMDTRHCAACGRRKGHANG